MVIDEVYSSFIVIIIATFGMNAFDLKKVEQYH